MPESINGTEANKNHSSFIGMTRDSESGDLKPAGHPTGITLPPHYANQDVFAGHRKNCLNNLTTGILEMENTLDRMRFDFLTALGVEPMPILPAGVWESLCREDQNHLKSIAAQKRILAPLLQVALFIGDNSDRIPAGAQG